MGANEERIKGKGEEIKGNLKQTVGRAIDDEQMEAEGHADELKGEGRQQAAKASERARGAGEELKGKVKGAAGDLLDNEQMEAEGRAEELKGKGRQQANQ
jgi:uncharacterized protein YjbJ (UPF0337 family)